MTAVYCENKLIFHGFNHYDNPMNNTGSVNQRWNSLSPEPHSGTESTASTPFVKSEFPFDDELFGIDQVNVAKNTLPPPLQYNRRFSKTDNSGYVKNEIEENILNFNVTSSEFQESNGAENQQIDIYRDLILRHLIQDISTTCAKLGLPTDPYIWSEEHGARWISEMCQQFNLKPPRHYFASGRMLLSMSQKDFECFLPEGGDTLYAQLQVWKTAFESYHPPASAQSSAMTAADHHQHHQTHKTTNWAVSSQTNNMAAAVAAAENPFTSGIAGSRYMHNTFFQTNTVLPSPSNSDTSSNGSQDMIDDDVDLRSGISSYFQHQNYSSDICNGANSEADDDDRVYSRHQGTVHLWQFIRELLDQPKQYSACVRWVDRNEGTFKIESSLLLARYWGQRKNRSQMNYDKLSRSLRQYYKKGIIQKPEKKQRLVYKFLPPYNM